MEFTASESTDQETSDLAMSNVEVTARAQAPPLIIAPARNVSGTDLVPVPDLTAFLIPRLVRDTGPKATNLFLEFFTVPFENRNTRQAYLQAVRHTWAHLLFNRV